MRKNMGAIDRIFRIVFALIVGLLYITHQITGITSVILLALSVIFVITAFVGTCPIYSLLGFSTKKEKAGSAI